jgi:hypothetical protein
MNKDFRYCRNTLNVTSALLGQNQDNNKPYLFLDDVDEDAKETLLNDFEGQLHEYCLYSLRKISSFPLIPVFDFTYIVHEEKLF